MYRAKRRILKIRLILFDMAAVGISFCLSYWLVKSLKYLPFQKPAPLRYYYEIIILIVLLWSVLLYIHNAYSHRKGLSTLNIWTIIKVNIWGSLILSLILFIFKIQWVNRSIIGFFVILSPLFLYTGRRLHSRWVAHQVMNGESLREVLIIGTGEQAKRIAKEIGLHPEFGFRIKCFLSLDPSEVGRSLCGSNVIGTVDRLPDVLSTETVDEVVFAIPLNIFEGMKVYLLLCDQMGISGRVILDLYEPAHSDAHVEKFFGLPTFYFSTIPVRLFNLYVKRFVDISVGSALFIILLPLITILAIVIKLTSKGTVLFRQARVGLNGRRFTLYKFRTMIEGAEELRDKLLDQNEMDGPVFKIKEDPRITTIGRFIRRFSLDEIPQLINVIRGDMSLVGPRPLPMFEAANINGFERRRFSMKPGITCLWQIKGRNLLNFKEWMSLDLEYIDQWSLWLDTKILLKTLPAILAGRGAY
jgi:exopolysaccharide biosynthesis polyprenyl glycosylphosphotransferase